jgi:hypothetical protein
MNCSRVILIFINQIFSKYMKASRIISIIVLCTAFSMLTGLPDSKPSFHSRTYSQTSSKVNLPSSANYLATLNPTPLS